MAIIDKVQLPNGAQYDIRDTQGNYASQTYVDNAIATINKTSIGLGNVDNTSDMNKPVSTAQGTAIGAVDTKATNNQNALTNLAKVKIITVDTSNWTQESGTSYYIKTLSVTALYGNPIVSQCDANGSNEDNEARRKEYAKLFDVRAFGDTSLILFATAIPTASFYSAVTGAE